MNQATLFDNTWFDIPTYEGRYQINGCGIIKTLSYKGTGKEKFLKLRKNRGYLRVCLYRNKNVKEYYSVHRLVYEAIYGEIPDGMQIDHINGNKNDNRIENLRCVTGKENQNNPVTRPKHIEANRKRLNKPVVQINKETGDIIRVWACAKDASREIGIDFSHISKCCRGKRKSAGGFIWRFAD